MIGLLKMPLLICQSGCRHISGNLLRQLEAQNKDVVAALQALLTGVKCQCVSVRLLFIGLIVKMLSVQLCKKANANLYHETKFPLYLLFTVHYFFT